MKEVVFQPNLGCGICYEGVTDICSAISMPCCHHTHILHHRCAFQWYLAQRKRNLPSTCPFCRSVVLTVAQFDTIYTLQDTRNPDPPTEAIYSEKMFPDADGPVLYMTNMHLVQLSHMSSILMLTNLLFIFVLFFRVGM